MKKFDKSDKPTSKHIVEDCIGQVIEVGDLVVYYIGGYRKELRIGKVIKINSQSVRIKQKDNKSESWDTQFGNKVYIYEKNSI